MFGSMTVFQTGTIHPKETSKEIEVKSVTKWDIYYHMRFIAEETGIAPTSKQVFEKFSHYDKDIVADGLQLYENIQVVQASENHVETEQEKGEREHIEKMCEEIERLPLKTLTDIQNAKEKSRPIPMSAEKVLLFKHLIHLEKELQERETK